MNIQLKIISFFLLVGCASSKTQNKEVDIIYEAQTRGRSEMVTFSNKQMQIVTSTEEKTVDLSEKQLKYINTLVSKIKMAEMSKYKAPSNKRAFDGAMNALIKMKVEKETYISSSFDHDNPPEELKALVKVLRTYIK